MPLGKLGVWQAMDVMTAGAAAAFVRRVEAWGYGALWIPESRGRNAPVHAAWLLANTTKLVVATGIANIYARDPQASAAANLALNEQSGGRFVLGLGVSHVPLVEGLRGHQYGKPVATMRAYLEGMQRAAYAAPKPAEAPRTVIAALGPQMLKLAAEQCDGAHPYLVSPRHTAEARALLPKGKLLCPEQTAVLETDPAKARKTGRGWLARYLELPNYRNNLKRLGFSDADLADGGSDKLVDAIVAWGDEAAIRHRIQQHWDADADHVCIQAITDKGLPDERLLAALAPAGR